MGVFILTALIVVVVYIRVRKSRYSKKYDVYMQNTTVNYEPGGGYEQVFSSIASGLDEVRARTKHGARIDLYH